VYKVSIITPNYNQVNFLEYTIQSVLNQTYRNLEYIIIDGGSSDGSNNIIKKYQRHLSYWVSEKDTGQSVAINKGFRKCTGDIIGWLNSDDLYLPGTLEYVADYFNSNPGIDFLYGNIDIIDESGENIFTYKELQFDKKMGALLGYGQIIPQPSAFWRKKVLNKVGYLNEEFHYKMDSEYWSRISDYFKVVHVNKTLAKFRLHSASKTNKIQTGNNELATKESDDLKRIFYNKLAISKYVPYKYSQVIVFIYRLKRIVFRFLLGHYFLKYNVFYIYKRFVTSNRS
jgi:glycosyltransferase involved in cell wall biosynthesis